MEEFDWLNPFATLVAAFIGAGAAFLLEAWRRRVDQTRLNYEALNQALYALSHYWDRQLQFQREVLDPYRGRADAWLNLNTTMEPPEGSPYPADPGHRLTFLLHGSAYPHL